MLQAPFNAEVLAFASVHLGGAVWSIQVFENTLAKFITLAFKLDPAMAQAEAVAILDKMTGKTLGGIITELKKCGSVNSAFEARLEKFREDRNWLIHNS